MICKMVIQMLAFFVRISYTCIANLKSR